MLKIGNDWDLLLKEEVEKDYYRTLREFLIDEYRKFPIYPPMDEIFNSLKYSSYKDTKVVIIGQDPYHQKGQAHGLCFSVNKGVRIPPSLQNIYKEQQTDLNITQPNHGCLVSWAEQGVLLLNATLTVRDSQPQSHKGKGWETFTDKIISLLNEREKPMVFILWGNNAKSKGEWITNPNHLVLMGMHPSPLSAHRGFFGGQYFSRANRFLETTGQKPIVWKLEE